MIRQIAQIFILVTMLSLASGAWATTYYIDWVGGADTNDGLTKSTPWKRAPGMVGCSDKCLSKKNTGVQPGDKFILKGGVAWPNSALGWLVNFSGNATTSSPGCTGNGCIYIGVDQNWYNGDSWARPILDAGGKKTATDAGGVSNYLMRLYANYIIVDNIEFNGLYWDSTDTNYGESVNLHLATGVSNRGTNITLKNLYIHGWSHDTYANGTRQRSCAIIGDTAIPNNNVNTILQDSIIDGSDTARDSCSGIFGSPPYIERNYFRYIANGMILNGTSKISGNTILNIGNCFDPYAHTNAIEINASNDIEISNNVIGHLSTGTIGIWSAPNQGYAANIFNNIIFDTYTSQFMNLSAPVSNNGCEMNGSSYCKYAGSTNVFNNTIECGPDSNPASVCTSINLSSDEVNIWNNHYITSATSPNGGVWSLATTGTGSPAVTATNNLVQSKIVANNEGYSIVQAYPLKSDGSTVNTGIKLDNFVSQIPASLYSTTCGVKYNESDHTIVGPNDTPVFRDSVWDRGAYEKSLFLRVLNYGP